MCQVNGMYSIITNMSHTASPFVDGERKYKENRAVMHEQQHHKGRELTFQYRVDGGFRHLLSRQNDNVQDVSDGPEHADLKVSKW